MSNKGRVVHFRRPLQEAAFCGHAKGVQDLRWRRLGDVVSAAKVLRRKGHVALGKNFANNNFTSTSKQRCRLLQLLDVFTHI